MRLTVGQTLWCVMGDRRRSGGGSVVVTRVGRKWAALSNRHKIDTETLEIDGGIYSSPGRCHLSRDDYERELAAVRSWDALVNSMRCRPPAGVTVADIEAAAKLLRLRVTP